MISKKEFAKCIKQALKNPHGTVWFEMGRLKHGEMLCLVFGWEDCYDSIEEYQIKEGDTFYTLCAKLAFNGDDLQCDYDIDWIMPYDEETGVVWDTSMAVVGAGDADFYNKEAEAIIDRYDNGVIKGVNLK